MPPRLSDYARVGARAALGRALGSPVATTIYRDRCWPRYCDLNLHMNYGAYLEVSELARLDWFVRTGLLRDWLGRGWQPVVGSMTVQYRRELKPLVAFQVSTRATGFERKALVVEHELSSAKGLHTSMTLNVVVRRRGGVVDRSELEPTVAHVLV